MEATCVQCVGLDGCVWALLGGLAFGFIIGLFVNLPNEPKE